MEDMKKHDVATSSVTACRGFEEGRCRFSFAVSDVAFMASIKEEIERAIEESGWDAFLRSTMGAGLILTMLFV